MTTTMTWRCPAWCPITEAEHSADSNALDNGAGGASHLLTTFDLAGADLPIVTAVVETEPDGRRSELVFIGGHEAAPYLARRFALAVLRAADLAEWQA
jgi:hypothetical protein